jgi:hypothetical protein
LAGLNELKIVTADGNVDLAFDASVGVAAEIVPEPGSLVILGMGLAALTALRRNRQAAAFGTNSLDR